MHNISKFVKIISAFRLLKPKGRIFIPVPCASPIPLGIFFKNLLMLPKMGPEGPNLVSNATKNSFEQEMNWLLLIYSYPSNAIPSK